MGTGRIKTTENSYKPATVKKDAAACQTGRPRIGVRCTTPDNRSWPLFFRVIF